MSTHISYWSQWNHGELMSMQGIEIEDNYDYDTIMRQLEYDTIICQDSEEQEED